MQCANCGKKKLFLLDAEELIPGSDVVFCPACQKKISPFLLERNHYPTHVEHLQAKSDGLKEAGVTPSGLDALATYCAYLDRIAPKAVVEEEITPSQPSEKRVARVVLAEEVLAPLEAQKQEVEALSQKVEQMDRRLRYTLMVAALGGATSLISLVALLIQLLGG